MDRSHGVCRNCGAAIRWARTLEGRWAPLHPEPHQRGSVLLDERGVTRPCDFDGDGPRYLKHWAVCEANR